MPRFEQVAITNCPLWTHLTPSYAVALLGAAARARGFEVVFPELEIHFYRHVTAAERQRWQTIQSSAWDDQAGTDAFFDRYADSFFGPRLDALLDAGVEVFAFSVNNRALHFTRRVVAMLKQKAPQVQVIAGGPTAFSAPQRLWEIPGIDAVCLGEGDIAFPDYLCQLREHGVPESFPGFAVRDAAGQVRQGGAPERARRLDALPFPDYSGHPLALYENPGTLATSISRGCIQRCTYCAESPQFGRFRHRSGDNLFAEVEHHLRSSGFPALRILLNDSVINGNLEALERFAERLIESGVRIGFGGMAVARETLTPELLGKLKRAGCEEISFGVESGSPDVLRMMNKRLQGPESVGRVLAATKQAGITTTVFILVGFPGETERHFHETLRFLRRNIHNIDQLMVNKLLVLPGSKLAEAPELFGLDGSVSIDGYRTLDGSTTPEIRDLRQQLLYLLFQEKMTLLNPIGGEGDDPVARLRQENQLLRGKCQTLLDRCQMLLGLLSDPAAPAAAA